MPNDDQWTTRRIAKAREEQHLVTEAVSARIASLLNSELHERPLPTVRLAAIAKRSSRIWLPRHRRWTALYEDQVHRAGVVSRRR